MLQSLKLDLGRDAELLHPFDSVLARGRAPRVVQPRVAAGPLPWSLHTPLDAFPLASDAVARGNRKVFAEIGLEFARYLALDFDAFMAGCTDPELRQAFAHLEAGRTAGEAELIVLANLEIGLHEQTRLQPEIREALDAALASEQGLLKRILGWPLQRRLTRFTREAITHSLMVLSLPGHHALPRAQPRDGDARVRQRRARRAARRATSRSRPRPTTAARATGRCSTSGCTTSRTCSVASMTVGELATAPFTPAQVERIRAGELPDGEL